MKLKFNEMTSWLLHGMLRQPTALPLGRCRPACQEFASKDRAGAILLDKIKRQWLEKVVLEKKPGTSADTFFFRDYEGSLKNDYAERLLEVVRHYEPLGFLADLAAPYWSLRDQLEGKVNAAEEDESLEETPQAQS